MIRRISGILGVQVQIQMKGQADRLSAWDLEITDTHLLNPGYSGSPVVDEDKNVIGVVNTRRGEGQTGVALSIETLKKVWAETPPPLKEQLSQNEASAASQHVAPASSGRQHTDSSQQERDLLLQCFDLHAGGVLTVAWQPTGDLIASAGVDGTVRLWEAKAGQSRLTYRGSNTKNRLTRVHVVVWSADGQRLASAGVGNTVSVWRAKDGQTLSHYEYERLLGGCWLNIRTLAWSPDDRQIASACSHTGGIDTAIHLWDPVTGNILHRYPTGDVSVPEFFVPALAWSPDGTVLAAAFGTMTVRLWETTTDRRVGLYPEWVHHLAWSADSRWLAAACANHAVRLWERSSEIWVRHYLGHTAPVRWVAWSPDGTRLASAADDKTVRLWNAKTGEPLFTYKGHTDKVTSVSWSPDGTCLASASNDKTVHVWQVP